MIGFCTCLLKTLQFLWSATGFLVFFTVLECENPRIRTQIVHLPMREEFKDTIFVKKILWPKFSKNDKTNIMFPLKGKYEEQQPPTNNMTGGEMLKNHLGKVELKNRDGVVVRASASQSVDLGFIPLFE